MELKENYGYINFDDERLISLKTEDLDRVLQAFYELYKNNFPEDKSGLSILRSNALKNIELLLSTNKDVDLLEGVYGGDIIKQ